jgi:hypothetical protein
VVSTLQSARTGHGSGETKCAGKAIFVFVGVPQNQSAGKQNAYVDAAIAKAFSMKGM